MDRAGSGTPDSPIRALFLNADRLRPRCALFDAGYTYGTALRLCKTMAVDYCEIYQGGPVPDVTRYDVVIFNYQHVTNQFIPASFFNKCKHPIGFLYEARVQPELSPTHFAGVTAGELFKTLISPDPTLAPSGRVWGVPRVVPRAATRPKGQYGITISTYGFPSPWKDLPTVIQMMNDEFKTATFRLNFASASHQEGTGLDEALAEHVNALKNLAKPGIKMKFTQKYMEREVLIKWLGMSDLNVFLARPERGEITGGALLASTDLAISSRAPLMVSKTLEARHLQVFAHDSLTKAISVENALEVQEAYALWSPENFAAAVDAYVEKFV